MSDFRLGVLGGLILQTLSAWFKLVALFALCGTSIGQSYIEK